MIADGKTGKAVGMEACWNVFGVVGMGESHPRLPHAIKDAVVLSAGDRYKELVKRVEKGLGGFDAESARHLMDRPVAMKSNLHSVLFETTTTRFWVANASKEGKPASEQPYHAFQLSELLEAPGRPIGDAVAAASGPSSPGGERGALSANEFTSSIDHAIISNALVEGRRGEHPDADHVDCSRPWSRSGSLAPGPWSRSPRKSTCKPRRAWPPSRESGGITT